MSKAQDATVKLAEEAETDPTKLTELLERTATPYAISPEGEAHLAKTPPPMKPDFLEAQAAKFNLPVDKVTEIADLALNDAGATLVMEKREFGVEEDVRTLFHELYEKEIAKRGKCTYVVATHEIGTSGKESTVYSACGDKFTGIQQAIVHHSLHLIFDCPDYRTQRAMLQDVKDTLWPVQEKSVRAALGVEERTEWMRNPSLRARVRG